MLGKISGADTILSLAQAKVAASRAKAASTGNAPGDAGAPVDERQQKAQDALTALKQANASQKQQRKGNARAKVDRLKKELETLRLMSGGDPKAVARRAAQIARELAAAAKEYAGAGGMTVSSAAGSPDAGAQAAAATPSEAGDAAAQAQAQVQAAGAEAAVPVAQPEPPMEENAEAAGAAPAAPPAEHGEKAGADPSQGHSGIAADALRTQVEERQRQAGEKTEDDKFAAEVRRLLAGARALIEQQRRRVALEGRDDDEFDGLARDVQQAGASIDQSFSFAGQGGVVGTFSLLV